MWYEVEKVWNEGPFCYDELVDAIVESSWINDVGHDELYIFHGSRGWHRGGVSLIRCRRERWCARG